MIEASGVALDRRSLDFVSGQLRLLGDRLLVEPLPVPQSQILLQTEERGTGVRRARVIACGPGEYSWRYNDNRSMRKRSRHFRPTEVKPGDVVSLEGFMYPEVILNGERLLIVSEKDVCGIHETDNAAS